MCVIVCAKTSCCSGMGDRTKTDKFSEKFQGERGEGVIFNQKIILQILGPLYKALNRASRKKSTK